MKSLFLILTKLIFKFPISFLIYLFLLIFQSIFNIFNILSIAPVVDLMTNKEPDQYSNITTFFANNLSLIGLNLNILIVFIIFSFSLIMSAIVNIFIQYVLLVIKYKVVNFLLIDSLTQFFKSKINFFQEGDMGTLLNSFNREVSKIGNTFGGLATVISSAFQAFVFLVLPLVISPKLTLSFLIIISFIIVPFWFVKGITYKLGKFNTETANKMSGILHSALTSAKLIISYAAQKQTIKIYQSSIIEHARYSVLFQLLNKSVSLIFTPLGTIAALIVLYYYYTFGYPLSELILILFAISRLVPVVSVVLHGVNSIQGFIPAFEQLERLKNDSKKYEETLQNNIFSTFSSSIEVKSLSYNHSSRGFKIKNLNLTFLKGKTSAIIGESGSGKTTVIDLLLGLYNFDKGQILIDGKDLNSLNLNSFRKKIGYVPQESQMFNLSIRDNFKWVLPSATDLDILNCCKISKIKDFIDSLPEGLDTIIGERGVLMSGGQRQRLSLARALLKKPEILILDEATSSLDKKSEELIIQSLDNLSKEGLTIIIVAHKSSLIENADIVYLMKSGQIIDSGRYVDLKNKKIY